MLQGSQVLTAFLIILPFNEGFARIDQAEKWVYTGTFLCSVISLIFFSAPAAHHRLQRPLLDREGFKEFATRMIVVGLVSLTAALSLATQLVLTEVVGVRLGTIVAGVVALVIGAVWWLIPLAAKQRRQTGAAT